MTGPDFGFAAIAAVLLAGIAWSDARRMTVEPWAGVALIVTGVAWHVSSPSEIGLVSLAWWMPLLGLAAGMAAVAVQIGAATALSRRWPLMPGDGILLGGIGACLGPLGLAWAIVAGAALSAAHRSCLQREETPAVRRRLRAAGTRHGGRRTPRPRSRRRRPGGGTRSRIARRHAHGRRPRRVAAQPPRHPTSSAWRDAVIDNPVFRAIAIALIAIAGAVVPPCAQAEEDAGHDTLAAVVLAPELEPGPPGAAEALIRVEAAEPLTLPELAARIAAATGHAVEIEERPSRTGVRSSLPDVPPQAVFWNGPLAGLLDLAATTHRYRWQWLAGRIVFYRYWDAEFASATEPAPRSARRDGSSTPPKSRRSRRCSTGGPAKPAGRWPGRRRTTTSSAPTPSSRDPSSPPSTLCWPTGHGLRSHRHGLRGQPPPRRRGRAMTRVTALVLAAWILAGCEFFRTMDPLPPAAEEDPAAALLTSAALRAEAALAELAQARASENPIDTQPPPSLVPTELLTEVTVDWTGPLDALARRLAERSGGLHRGRTRAGCAAHRRNPRHRHADHPGAAGRRYPGGGTRRPHRRRTGPPGAHRLVHHTGSTDMRPSPPRPSSPSFSPPPRRRSQTTAHRWSPTSSPWTPAKAVSSPSPSPTRRDAAPWRMPPGRWGPRPASSAVAGRSPDSSIATASSFTASIASATSCCARRGSWCSRRFSPMTRDAFLLARDQNRAASAGRVVTILAREKLVSAVPSWTDFLVRTWPDLAVPAAVLFPRGAEEEALWQDWVREGWREGRQLADEIFADDLDRLNGIFTGLILWHRLHLAGMVTAPMIGTREVAVAGGGETLRIAERFVAIDRAGEPGERSRGVAGGRHAMNAAAESLWGPRQRTGSRPIASTSSSCGRRIRGRRTSPSRPASPGAWKSTAFSGRPRRRRSTARPSRSWRGGSPARRRRPS